MTFEELGYSEPTKEGTRIERKRDHYEWQWGPEVITYHTDTQEWDKAITDHYGYCNLYPLKNEEIIAIYEYLIKK